MRIGLLLTFACASQPRAQRPIDARASWRTLEHTLPGRWIATANDSTVPVEFHEVAAGTVVLETFGSPGHQTVTAYHADGSGLVATHYCAQGNQPRLRAREGDARHVVLVTSDATGVDPGEAMLVELRYDFEADGFTRTEVYRQPSGALERTPWHYRRALE